MRKPRPGVPARVAALVAPWSVLGVAAVAGASVVAGVFDPGFGARWFTTLVGVAVVALVVVDGRARLRGERARRPFAELEGPVLWIVSAWMLMRLGGAYAAHLTPVAAALVAWLVATFPRHVWGFAVGVALALEVGLAMAGRQDFLALGLHLALFGGAAAALTQLTRLESFRRRLTETHAAEAKARAEEATARDFGLQTAQAPVLRALPGPMDGRHTVGRMTLDYLTESFNLQLDLLREALDLTTAAVLWRDADGGAMQLRGVSTVREDLVDGPYTIGAGLPGSVLRDVREVAVAPVHAGFNGLPYYADASGVGGAMAVAVPAPAEVMRGGDGQLAGVLCVDRQSDRSWSDAERRALRIAARKLALDVATGQRLKATDHERSTIRRFCVGLQELNGALGLEQVADAALQAVRAMVPVDLSVISLVDGDVHRVVRASGVAAERYTDLRFTTDEGLVGRAVKVRHALPAGGVYKGSQPVFTAGDKLSEMRSLRVVPLLKEGQGSEPLGALTVAARAEGVLGSPHEEMLALIAGQVAIKLGLARAHEQIRELATTDGLTGLNNHRTFQQAFDAMLGRADRRGGQMALLLTDIDHFKRLNDNYGHPFGDEVLKGVARVLATAVRKIDLAARYGGEEFAVLLEDAEPEGAAQMAERIRSEVEQLTFTHEKGPVKVTLSIGVATFPADGREKATLIENADQALYTAKHGGRNQVVAFTEVARSVPARTSAP